MQSSKEEGSLRGVDIDEVRLDRVSPCQGDLRWKRRERRDLVTYMIQEMDLVR